jgi:lipopolysaccharide biosynthesis glycosyltransferase
MIRLVCVVLLLCSLSASVFTQKTKPWTEWSKKEVDKTLNDSAWAQTQTETDTSSMNYQPTAVTATTASRTEDKNIAKASQTESGATNAPVSIKYHVRLLSAKPVREAFARMVLLAQDKPNEELSTQLQSFVDRDFGEYIVVAVSVEGSDRRFLGPAAQTFVSATTEQLKNGVYLERKDGKRIFLMEYRPPTNDGMGAKFVFPRMSEGHPFLSSENENVRFAAEMSQKVKLNVKYKTSEMMYDGKLEY